VKPGDDLRLVLRLQIRQRVVAHALRQLHLAQGDRQQRRATVHALGKALDDAKLRRGELGQRRHRPGGHLQRKLVDVAQRPPIDIDEARRQHDAHPRVFAKRRIESDLLHLRVLRVLLGAQHRSDAARAVLQADRLRQLARHRSVEAQAERLQRHARRLRVFALAAEARRKRLAHGIVITHFHAIGQAAGRAHPGAIDQGHLTCGRQTARAAQGQHTLRLRRRNGLQPVRLENGSALRRIDRLDRDLLAQTGDAAMHRLQHA